MEVIAIDTLRREIEKRFCDGCRSKDREEFKAGYCCEMIEDTMNFIETLPTIEVETVSDWISVKDKLPDDDVDVLLHDTYCGTLIGWYDEKEGIFKTDYISQLEAVTRWVPLPGEAKEDGDNECG